MKPLRMKRENFERRGDDIYLRSDSHKARPICKTCMGEGQWWDYGRKDVVTCPDCKGKGRARR